MAYRKVAFAALLVAVVVCALMREHLCAPVLEAESNSELRLKQKTEDLDQFYKDQEHLLPHRNNMTTSQPEPNIGQLVVQIWNPTQWLGLLSQLGIRVPDATTIQSMVVGIPLNLISQFVDYDNFTNRTRPILITDYNMT